MTNVGFTCAGVGSLGCSRMVYSIVDADVFLDGFFQFFFYFRLRLAEDVFDDGLASFRIVTDCVPALPSTVLSFADVPFPVRSSFRHGISPFRQRTIP